MRKSDVPCAKDCPGRNEHCHAVCESYKEYRARKDVERDAKNEKTYILWQLRCFELDKHKRLVNTFSYNLHMGST